MANVRDLRNRIRSVKSTQKVTRAMKMVAAAKLRRAQEAALASRPYGKKMAEVLSAVAARADVDAHPLFRENPSQTVVVAVVTSDRGLCGGFNTNLCKKAGEYVKQRQDRSVQIYAIGKKARDYFRRRHFQVKKEKLNVFAKLTYGHAKALAAELIEMYRSGEVGEVVIAYNEFKSALSPRLMLETLLPIPKPPAAEGAAVDYIYEPRPQEILATLVERHLDTKIWGVLLESQAAEHAARMTAMEGATKNAGEMIDRLTLIMNKARQASITTQLIEIVSGAAALTE